MTKPQLIATITSLQELEGYEAEARKRGLQPEEIRALHDKRAQLGRRK